MNKPTLIIFNEKIETSKSLCNKKLNTYYKKPKIIFSIYR